MKSLKMTRTKMKRREPVPTTIKLYMNRILRKTLISSDY